MLSSGATVSAQGAALGATAWAQGRQALPVGRRSMHGDMVE